MIPAHLLVLCFVRVGQVLLALFLFWKAYSLRAVGSVDVYCRSNLAASLSYDVSFPFAWIGVTGVADCSSDATTSTTWTWTGFAPTTGLFAALVAATVAQAVACVCVYVWGHQWYESEKKWPACDLLASLLLACGWALDTGLAWHWFPQLRQAAHPDTVAGALSVCSAAGGYCNANQVPDLDDVSSFLFLGLACALSCAVAVWFVFMETGLCPDDDEDEDLTDFAVLPHAVPFFPDDSKSLACDSARNGHQQHVQQQMLLYLSQQRHEKGETDRFANGFTFTPIHDSGLPVHTISGSPLTRDSVPVKVHDKFNLFKA